ncbi:MAG: GtrA family protein [Bacteroidetes bacterium]|jgi:putative flippase GtrA|nr:GtrA family protein [Bacteroidota bacterium]
MIKFTVRILNLKVVRYFFSAASATVVDVGIYFLAFNYLFHKEDLQFSFYTFSAPTASLALSYTCGLMTNFFLTKNLVFKESDLKGHHQFLRFVLVAIGVLFLNYILMNFLIRQMQWYPTIARAFSAVSIGVLSFIVHKTFSFRVSNTEEVED